MNMKKIVVAGGGVLGSQIALQSAFCGFDVTIWLRSEGSIERAQPKLLRLKEIYLNTLETMKTNPAAYCRGFSCESELSADKINELKQKVEDAYDSITLTTSYEEAGNDADLIILVLNNNECLNKDDLMLLESTKNKKRIIFINKCDLESKVSIGEEVVYGNTITNDGLDNLKSKIKELFNIDGIIKSDMNYLSSATHISTLKECLKIVDDILIALENNLTVDMLEIDIKKIWELLGNLIGDSYDEELLDNLFSKFCLGK